ncbi:hypothetical protein DKX38_021197 [Salix brachista]|uniref:RRM domain-containing protein n=1 Tax=Salix brachista TaxID=2182728 RepID=A0A5N5KBE8_9ROSI|nr:hypothetical protein DKX38_021197 [Salix brachista]
MSLYSLLFFFSDYSDGGVDAKLYIAPIPRTTTEENIPSLFEEHGSVVEVVLPWNKWFGQQDTRCAFFKFAHRDMELEAIKALNIIFTMRASIQLWRFHGEGCFVAQAVTHAAKQELAAPHITEQPLFSSKALTSTVEALLIKLVMLLLHLQYLPVPKCLMLKSHAMPDLLLYPNAGFLDSSKTPRIPFEVDLFPIGGGTLASHLATFQILGQLRNSELQNPSLNEFLKCL